MRRHFTNNLALQSGAFFMLQRAFVHVAIGALETDATAHARDGIRDQTDCPYG